MNTTNISTGMVCSRARKKELNKNPRAAGKPIKAKEETWVNKINVLATIKILVSSRTWIPKGQVSLLIMFRVANPKDTQTRWWPVILLTTTLLLTCHRFLQLILTVRRSSFRLMALMQDCTVSKIYLKRILWPWKSILNRISPSIRLLNIFMCLDRPKDRFLKRFLNQCNLKKGRLKMESVAISATLNLFYRQEVKT